MLTARTYRLDRTFTRMNTFLRIDDIVANLGGGPLIRVIDLHHARLQIEVEEKSKPFLTINTRRGLYHYQHLPYGVASAPTIWQRAMNQVLQGIPRVFFYLDDISVHVTGYTVEEHLEWLVAVLWRLESTTYGALWSIWVTSYLLKDCNSLPRK